MKLLRWRRQWPLMRRWRHLSAIEHMARFPLAASGEVNNWRNVSHSDRTATFVEFISLFSRVISARTCSDSSAR